MIPVQGLDLLPHSHDVRFTWDQSRIAEQSQSRNAGGGWECAGCAAIAAALYDATGEILRRLPLKPAYVQAMLEV